MTPANGSSRRILLVDDQLIVTMALRKELEACGYHVSTARDGLDALEILETEPIDVIISDIRMPRLNGYQLYQWVRQIPALDETPFVFVSANDMDSDVAYGLEMGADGYITKPIDAKAVIELLDTLDERAAAQESSASPAVESPAPESVLTVGSLRIHMDTYRALLGPQELDLSLREFRLLERLAQEPNEVVAAEKLLVATHGDEAHPDEASNLLRPLVRSVRRKLGYSAGEMGCIRNLRGVGYMLVPPNHV
jgi:DNA-binding response OmpR family regulator